MLLNILVVAHFQNDGSPSALFIHDQVLAYLRLGHHVRVIVPVAIGKRDYTAHRFGSPVIQTLIDGVDHVFLRYLSFSRYGEGWFNPHSAITALRPRLTAVLHGFVPDIIHAHTLGFDSEIGAWLKKQLRCPLVVTTHGSDASIPFEKGRRVALKTYCDKADTVVAVSSALAGKLVACNLQTSVTSILNGFQLKFLSSDIEKMPFSFLQVGNLIKQKKVDVTIRVFAEIHKQYPSATLTIVGQGEERGALEILCNKLHLCDSITFKGQISNEQVLREMAKAEFFIMPSVREGFGIVYLEAMASGCITIGTQGEGVADLIISGKNGILVPPDDMNAVVTSVIHYIEHSDEAADLAIAGKKSAISLTWDRNVAQYVSLFNSLLTQDFELTRTGEGVK